MELLPLGDAALLVRLAEDIGEAASARVLAAAARLSELPFDGLIEAVPGYTTLAVHYDPAAVARSAEGAVPYDVVRTHVTGLLANAGDAFHADARTIEIPVCYEPPFSPDLGGIAARAGLTIAAAVESHAGATYTVAMLGFMPGFPYMHGLPAALATPRHATPRVRVPAGSVGIADAQTGIYPLESPGGWQLIGRTPLRLFDPAAERPTLLAAGDRVRFRPIDAAEFARMHEEEQ